MAELEVVYKNVDEAADQLNNLAEILETGITIGHIAAGAAAIGTAFGCGVCADMAMRFEVNVRPVMEDIRDMCLQGHEYLKQVVKAMEAADALAEQRFNDARQILDSLRQEAAMQNVL